MQCAKPIRIFKNLCPITYPDGLEVPCGKCLNCRMSKRREWTMRMLHELDSWKHSIFITLTYSDEYLPPNASLVKADLQKFFKRLRKLLGKRKIKYFACGEYGDETNRPHYHAIIFGLSIAEKDYIIAKWPFGEPQSQHVGLAEPDSIRYVAQYIDKKLSGDEAYNEYDLKGREPVFRILSQGIGKEYVKKNSQQLKDNERITMNGKTMSFPRYYLKLLDLESSDFRQNIAFEKDLKQVHFFSGIPAMTFDEVYKTQNVETVKRLYDKIVSKRQQSERNLEARKNLKKRKL